MWAHAINWRNIPMTRYKMKIIHVIVCKSKGRRLPGVSSKFMRAYPIYMPGHKLKKEIVSTWPSHFFLIPTFTSPMNLQQKRSHVRTPKLLDTSEAPTFQPYQAQGRYSSLMGMEGRHVTCCCLICPAASCSCCCCWTLQLIREHNVVSPPPPPSGITGRLSQLQISIMEPSGSWKKSWSTQIPPSSTLLCTYSIFISLSFFSTVAMLSHCHVSREILSFYNMFSTIHRKRQ